jgi:hypothetical protein
MLQIDPAPEHSGQGHDLGTGGFELGDAMGVAQTILTPQNFYCSKVNIFKICSMPNNRALVMFDIKHKLLH